MARLYKIKKARASTKNRVCGKCGKPIEVGQAFVTWSFKLSATHGVDHYRHDTPACRPQPWEYVTNNPKKQAHYRATDFVDAANLATIPSNAASSLRDAISEVESIIEDLDDTLGNWQGTNFENTQQYADFETTKDALDDWKGEAESVADDLETYDDKCAECDGEGVVACPDCDEGTLKNGDDCDSCGGQGTIACGSCDGSGENPEAEWKSDLDNLDPIPDLEF